MNDATRITEMNADNTYDISATAAKIARKENVKSNANRVSWRQKSDNPKSDGSIPTPNNNVNFALNEHEDLLQFLNPILESLQSKTAILPAKDLASLVLSAAVQRKNALEKLLRTSDSEHIPDSARHDFKLAGSKKIAKSKEFKKLAEETAKQVEKYQVYLKDQILAAQRLELEASIAQLQKKQFIMHCY